MGVNKSKAGKKHKCGAMGCMVAYPMQSKLHTSRTQGYIFYYDL